MSTFSSKNFDAGLPNQVTRAIVPVPTVATDLFTTDGQIFQISITNGTAGDLTITILDKQGTPRAAMRATTIRANSTVSFNWDEGLTLVGGMNWVASGVGLEASIVAYYKN